MIPKIRVSPTEYMVRLATAADIPAMVEQARMFAEEVRYCDHAEFCPDATRHHLEIVVPTGAQPFILAYHKTDGLVGCFAYTLDKSYWARPIAVLTEFYVKPAHRATPVARMLLRLGFDLMYGDGACAFHAPLTTNLPAVKSLQNLLAKAGMQPHGVYMKRGL